MLTIGIQEVPSFLRQSNLYKKTLIERKDKIEVPPFCFKQVNQILNMNEFRTYLKIHSYWQFNNTPSTIYDYLVYHKNKSEVQEYLQTKEHFKYLGETFWAECDICFYSKTPHCISWKAAAAGLYSLFVYSHKKGWYVSEDSLYLAAENGHLNCVRYGLENNISFEQLVLSSKTARCGHLSVLIFLIENNISMDESTIIDAARNGHYHCLMYLCEYTNIKYNTDIILSVTKDYQCIKYLEYKKNINKNFGNFSFENIF